MLRRRTRHVVTEIERVRATVAALHAGDLAEVGRLFDTSHASLRDDYEVSCAELDVSVEAARGAGALGARMTGGGFGGSSIALLPAAAVDDAIARDHQRLRRARLARADVLRRHGRRGRPPQPLTRRPNFFARCENLHLGTTTVLVLR